MPKPNAFQGCYIADRSQLRTQIDALKGKKTATRLHLFEALVTVRQYIDVHFDQKITIEALAQKVCVSQSHLMREFKKAYGMSLYTYIISRKMAHARHLLSSTTLTVSEIALRCGYQNLSSFSSLFTREHHLSPLQFRQKQK